MIRAKMDRAQRAKQFAPFAALKGFEEALRAKENLAWGSHYKCRICVCDVAEEIELMYYRSRNMWTLKRR